MKLLVTGGAGFIGSNFIRYMLSMHDDVEIVNIDTLTYAGNLENLMAVERDPSYTFVRCDITSIDDVEAIFRQFSFDAVVNFAAESHVDRSIHMGVEAFIRTNILGVQHLLDASRAHGIGRFLQVSTDEVYGSLGDMGKFTEDSPIQPNNPYAASKASADFMVRAALKTHGLDAVITRCSNNFGPFQFPEKLIPLMIANAREERALPVYGDGCHVRDWIYVRDHCAAIDKVLREAPAGSIYNIGGEHDVQNIEIVRTILRILEKPESLIRFVQDRPGHDRRYAMDCSRLRNDLGWRPEHAFEEAIAATVDWYLQHETWLNNIRDGSYADYYDGMYTKRLADVEED